MPATRLATAVVIAARKRRAGSYIVDAAKLGSESECEAIGFHTGKRIRLAPSTAPSAVGLSATAPNFAHRTHSNPPPVTGVHDVQVIGDSRPTTSDCPTPLVTPATSLANEMNAFNFAIMAPLSTSSSQASSLSSPTLSLSQSQSMSAIPLLECREQIDEMAPVGVVRLDTSSGAEILTVHGDDSDSHDSENEDDDILPPELLDPIALAMTQSPAQSLSPCRLLVSVVSIKEPMDCDTLSHMYESEESYAPSSHYLRNHPHIDPSMRPILVDWMVEVAAEFRLQRETLYLSINFLDRFMTKQLTSNIHTANGAASLPITRNNFQLLGICCLWLAGKLEEIYPPAVKEFTNTTDGAYSTQDLSLMERVILEQLEWRLQPSTAYAFLKAYIKATCLSIAHASNDNESMRYFLRTDLFTRAMELIDFTLLDCNFLNYWPSALAASVMLVVYHSPPTSECMRAMMESTRYSVPSLLPCIEALSTITHANMSINHAHRYTNIAVEDNGRAVTRSRSRDADEQWTRQTHHHQAMDDFNKLKRDASNAAPAAAVLAELEAAMPAVRTDSESLSSPEFPLSSMLSSSGESTIDEQDAQDEDD